MAKRTSNCTKFSLAVWTAAGLACGNSSEPSAPVLRAVRYVTVEKTSERAESIFSGSLEAGTESKLSFQVAGRIRKLPVKAGQRVKRAQLIAELDPTDFELQLREARANANQAKAQADNAEANYRRVRRLYETRNTSRQELEAAGTQRDASKSAFAAARETVNRLKRQLSYTQLEAPASGTINSVIADVNEVVAAGSPIAVLQAGEALKTSVDIPEAIVRSIRLGDPASVKIGALDLEVEGTIQEIGVASEGAGVFPVMVKLSSDPPNARPGMVAEVILRASDNNAPAPKGFRVPLTAVGEDRDGRFVFLLEGEPGGTGSVRRHSVKTGELTARGIYVEEGLEEGQRIVVAGVSRIQNGLKVRIPTKPAGEDGF